MATPGGALIGLGAVLITNNYHPLLAILFASVGAALIGVIISGLNYKRFILPMQTIITSINKIASGNLATTIDEKSVGELEPIAVATNNMSNTWLQILEKVTNMTDEVATQTTSLHQVAENSNEVFQQVSTKIDEVANSASAQSIGTSESVQAMNEIAQSIQHITEIAKNISDLSNDSFLQAEQVNLGSNNIINQMQTIERSVKITSDYVEQLGTRSDKIVEIIAVISDISEQTSLLALNASIEAARAGEHGRGFAVVAEEVRNLAEESEQSAAEISNLVTDVNENIANSIKTMKNLEKIVLDGINIVSENDNAIDKIVQATKQVDNEIIEVSSRTDDLSASSEQVFATLEQISDSTKLTANNSKEVAQLIENQLVSINNIYNVAENLSYNSTELQLILENFSTSAEDE